jgi:hypothetical protein
VPVSSIASDALSGEQPAEMTVWIDDGHPLYLFR